MSIDADRQRLEFPALAQTVDMLPAGENEVGVDLQRADGIRSLDDPNLFKKLLVEHGFAGHRRQRNMIDARCADLFDITGEARVIRNLLAFGFLRIMTKPAGKVTDAAGYDENQIGLRDALARERTIYETQRAFPVVVERLPECLLKQADLGSG